MGGRYKVEALTQSRSSCLKKEQTKDKNKDGLSTYMTKRKCVSEATETESTTLPVLTKEKNTPLNYGQIFYFTVVKGPHPCMCQLK